MRGDHEHPAGMAHLGLGLHLRPDHEAGRVAERDDGQAMGIAQLHEARGLVGGIGIDGPAEVARIVADKTERPAADAHERGDHAAAEAGAQLEHRVVVGQAAHDRAHVVAAQAVLGNGVAQGARVGAAAVGDAALEIGQVLLRRGDRGAFVVRRARR